MPSVPERIGGVAADFTLVVSFSIPAAPVLERKGGSCKPYQRWRKPVKSQRALINYGPGNPRVISKTKNGISLRPKMSTFRLIFQLKINKCIRMYDDTKLRRVVKILQVFRKNKQFLRNAGWCVSSVKSPRWWGGVRNYDEVVITAILVQQSTWTSVEKSLKRLRRAKLSKLEVLGDKKVTMIERLIAPVGLGKQKAERLIGVSRGVSKMGGLDRLRRVENVRDLLTSIRGVGSETADSIALFALNKRTVPISGYVRRVLGRFGIINQEDNYEKLRNLVLKAIGDNLYELKIFYAGVTSVGRTVCKSRPKCDLCPLRDFCSFAYISGLSNPLRPKV